MTNKKLLDFLWRVALAYYTNPETLEVDDPIPEEDLVLIFAIGALILNRPEPELDANRYRPDPNVKAPAPVEVDEGFGPKRKGKKR